MHISDIDRLGDLADDELWDVAADSRNLPDIRHEAIRMWLFADDDLDGESGGRLTELKERAAVISADETEEDDIEEYDRQQGPYFDGEGRLIVEHDGVQYLIEDLGDQDSGFQEE